MKRIPISSMRRFINKRQLRMLLFLAVLFAGIFTASVCTAATGEELVAAFDQMQEPSLSPERVLAITDYTIDHHDFSLKLESGLLYLYDPVTIDSKPREWGGLFVGRSEFIYKPSVPGEIEQLKRFYGTDLLAISVNEIELIFGQQQVDQLQAHSEFKKLEITDRVRKSVKEQHQFLAGRKQISYLYAALKGIAFPGSRPFLIANAALGKFGQTIYTFDPYAREEVSLQLHSWAWVGGDYFDLVTSYSQYSTGTLATMNGMDKDQLKLTHYDLNATLDIEGHGYYEAIIYAAVTKPTQMIRLDLNHELEISNVDLSGHGPVLFKRSSENKYKQTGLWLFFDNPQLAGDTIELLIKYAGELINQAQVGFGAISESSWYPKYNSRAATFDLNFSSTAKRALAVSGKLLSSEINNDTLYTNWSITEPASQLSFSLTTSRKYKLAEVQAVPIEVFYDPRVHVQFMYDHQEQKTIAEDLVNSIKLNGHHFGPFQYAKLRATELNSFSGQSFPGLVHLGFTTTDENGRRENDRFFRAWETARQWWGNQTDYTSYHDAWLAESFAEYSALMYIQATTGNYKFLEKLGSYQDQIFEAGNSHLATNVESSSIMLGPRAASTETDNQQRLVIYKKGAFVLHMLRNLLLDLNSMSDEKFQFMMREWYRTLKGRSATTYEFKRLVDKYIGEDMSWFFDQYIIGTDLPTYYFSYKTELLSDGRTAISCHLEQTGVPDGFKMYLPIEIKLATSQKIYMRLLVDQLSGDIELPLVKGIVKTVTLNPFNSVLCRVENR